MQQVLISNIMDLFRKALTSLSVGGVLEIQGTDFPPSVIEGYTAEFKHLTDMIITKGKTLGRGFPDAKL